MDLKDKRLWSVVAVIVVLLVIGYAAGWFGGTSEPEPQSQEQGTEEQETPTQQSPDEGEQQDEGAEQEQQ